MMMMMTMMTMMTMMMMMMMMMMMLCCVVFSLSLSYSPMCACFMCRWLLPVDDGLRCILDNVHLQVTMHNLLTCTSHPPFTNLSATCLLSCSRVSVCACRSMCVCAGVYTPNYFNRMKKQFLTRNKASGLVVNHSITRQ